MLKDPPESFNHKVYKDLYLSNKNYHEKQQIYNHYLSYGKQHGHACNHNLIIFYHSPKCAGTSLHYGLILPSLFKQYSCNNNYVYNINWIDEQSLLTLFTTINYTSIEIPFQNIVQIHHSNTQDHFRSITVKLNQTNTNILLNQSKLLSIIIKSPGFKNSEEYIKILTQDINFYDKYIVLREPHSLQESIFYYLRDVGVWERTHGKFDKTTSYREYIRCEPNLVHWNWLIRQMAQIIEQEKINKCHADLCIEKLSKFSQIGFLEHFDSFVGYLCEKYNWHLDDNSTINLNKNTISKKESLSEEDNLFLQNKLYYDKEVYDFFLSKYKLDANIT